ncbi:MAG: hypothetical protein K0S08_1423 [Gammaproteobacteria bacterium]|jgi:hypothetical protein|nr:hypothetical protein [Gammaproteobacteria bacterium]
MAYDYDPLAILLATLPNAYLQFFEGRYPDNLLIKTARELKEVVLTAPRFVCYVHYFALLKLLDLRQLSSDKHLPQLGEFLQGSDTCPRIPTKPIFSKAPESLPYFSLASPKKMDEAFAYLGGGKAFGTVLCQAYLREYFQAVAKETESLAKSVSQGTRPVSQGESIERFLVGSGFSSFINGVRLSLVPRDERLSYARYVLAGLTVDLFEALRHTKNLCMTAVAQLQTFFYEKKGVFLATLEDEGSTVYQFDCEEPGAPIRVTSTTYVHRVDQIDDPQLTKVTACYEVYLPGQRLKKHDSVAWHIHEVKPKNAEGFPFNMRVFCPVIELTSKKKSELITELKHQAAVYDAAIAKIDSTLSASKPSPRI